ncbi:Netrin-1 [Fasciola gigantica]|uniref:Netrin-1 n=1 Tax=Fasciola gigantica TaxID=46835 RepID=A0A504YFC8_FASGI|nr:Netrin-1 [Fasciola gigantica]
MRLTHAYFTAILCILTHLSQIYQTKTTTDIVAKPLPSLNDPKKIKTRERRQLPLSFDSSASRCQIGSADVPCLPPFKNIVHGLNVETTTNCGLEKPQRLCRTDGTCQLCEPRPGRRFSSDHLTDKHGSQNQTCWASGQVRPGGPEQAVNLTISLGKRFEVYYISLQPCSIGSLPDSIAIYKSSDFGRNWRPWHFFSTDCYRAFGLPTTDEYNSHITSANLQEVLCVALQPQEGYLNRQMRRRRSMPPGSLSSDAREYINAPDISPDWVIAFSTTLGRPSQRPWSPALIDWMTMTDIRISMTRFPHNIRNGEYEAKLREVRAPSRNFIHRSPLFRQKNRQDRFNHSHSSSRYLFSARYTRALHVMNERGSRELLPSNLANKRRYSVNLTTQNAFPQTDPEIGQSFNENEPDILSDNEFYAFADLAIGGRCKCNGHAGDCIYTSDGQLRCACEHNTEGVDCERCRSGYMDKPWERATEQHANVCTKCECNLHSDECRFSNSLYLMSNRISGGICENCRHNTAGRNCQHCAEGFYRDWTKPISHEHVCLPCRCHPIGSLVRHECDRRSGQCRCKQGVTGLTCDRCQDHYHQTRSPTNPCTKDTAPQGVALAHTPLDIHCSPCNTNKERIRLKKFCRKDAVFQAKFKSRELHGTMARFEMQVFQIWRLNRQPIVDSKLIYWPEERRNALKAPDQFETESDSQPLQTLIPVWVYLNELRCKCPEIELGINYLIVTDFEGHTHEGRMELRFTPKTALLPWRTSWKRRLTRFRRRQNRGACDRYKDSGKLRNYLTRASHQNTIAGNWRSTRPSPEVGYGLRKDYLNPPVSPSHRPYHQYHQRKWQYPLS